MAMQKNAWMTSFLLKKFLSFFKKSIPCGISQTYRHWLILDGHRLHFTLETIDEMHEFHLYMINVPSHTLHAFQPSDIFCFKHFKITLRKKNDATMTRRKYNELDKIALAKWVDKVLN
jgi:hypothetical protein